MRVGHREAQKMFLELGWRYGFDVRSRFTSDYPTDGVWFTHALNGDENPLPVVAIEVIVSESPKTIYGSIVTLERVSPALGILLLHEREFERRLIRDGRARAETLEHIARLGRRIDEHLRQTKQRLVRWSYASLEWRYDMAGRGDATSRRAPANRERSLR